MTTLLIAIICLGFEHLTTWYGLRQGCAEANPFLNQEPFWKWGVVKILLTTGLWTLGNDFANTFIAGGFFTVGISNIMAIYTIKRRGT